MALRIEPSNPRSGPRQERVAAFKFGLSAESREIDIVARRRHALVFVEVMARERIDDAAEAVTERTRRRIVAAAELWLARHPDDAQRTISFDVMLVAPGKMPRHIANAFDTSR